MTVALEFARVSKQFTLQHERPESLQERFVQGLRRRSTATPFWALRDVSFEVRDGETFGILGRNGAGKSTLLKLATGILRPTSGQVTQHRRTYAMLELGAGFHPELTGRDNVLLNGSIHGLSRAQTRAIFDRIVDFAELEEFIDTPVKHYSSGMYMRLGFATAIHMNPELLVIDEILAVGDAAFRRKCTDALWALRRHGVTILFVSHNEEAVYQFCDRAVLLSHGQVAALGAVDEVVSVYAHLLEERESAAGAASPLVAVQAVAILDVRGRETLSLAPDEPWSVEVLVATPPGLVHLTGEVVLQTDTGSPVVAAPLHLDLPDNGARLRPLRVTFDTLPLAAGRLRVHVRVTAASDDGVTVTDAYEFPQSITVGHAAHGPLVQVSHRWHDRLAANGAALPAGVILDDRDAPDVADIDLVLQGCFAEAVTGADQQTLLMLANPGPVDARVRLGFAYGEASAGPPGGRLTLQAGAMTTLDLGEVAGRGKELAVTVAADRPLICRRNVTIAAYPPPAGAAYNRPSVAAVKAVAGAHASGGAAALSSQWWFAEGYTGPGFETYVAVANVGAQPTSITMAYHLADGMVVRRQAELQPSSRRTIATHDARDALGLGPGQVFFVTITSTHPIIAERVTYCHFDGNAELMRGIAAAVGTPAPAHRWLFPMGVEEPAWDVFLALANLGPRLATVEVTSISADAPPVCRQLTVPAGRRVTIAAHEPATTGNPAGNGRDHAASIQVSSTEPVLAERLVYGRHAADSGSLVTVTNASLGRAEPVVAGEAVVLTAPVSDACPPGQLILLNPGSVDVETTISLWQPEGWQPVTTAMVPAERRRIFDIGTLAPRHRATSPLALLRVAAGAGAGSFVAETWRLTGATPDSACLATDTGLPDVWSGPVAGKPAAAVAPVEVTG